MVSEESIRQKAYYEGVKEALRTIRREILDQQVETPDEFLDLITDLEVEYLGDDE